MFSVILMHPITAASRYDELGGRRSKGCDNVGPSKMSFGVNGDSATLAYSSLFN